MPSLAEDLLASGFVLRAAGWFTFAGLLGLLLVRCHGVVRLVAMQVPLLLFHLTALVPIAELGDQLRQLPVRQVAKQMIREQRPGEPLAMVGAMRCISTPAKWCCTRADRWSGEPFGSIGYAAWSGRPLTDWGISSVLLVIDKGTALQQHWRGMEPQQLGVHGIYAIWRLDRRRLERRAAELMAEGVDLDWRDPRPERF